MPMVLQSSHMSAIYGVCAWGWGLGYIYVYFLSLLRIITGIYYIKFEIQNIPRWNFLEMLYSPCDRQWKHTSPLQWCHNERDGVSNHQPHDCLLNRLLRHRSKKTSKLRVTGVYDGNSPVTGEFPAQRASNVDNVSIWWPHHADMPP